MKRLTLSLLLALACAQTAFADTSAESAPQAQLEKASAAYANYDTDTALKIWPEPKCSTIAVRQAHQKTSNRQRHNKYSYADTALESLFYFLCLAG